MKTENGTASARVDALVGQTNWISIVDGLPGINRTCLCGFPHDTVIEGRLIELADYELAWLGVKSNCVIGGVTRWKYQN